MYLIDLKLLKTWPSTGKFIIVAKANGPLMT